MKSSHPNTIYTMLVGRRMQRCGTGDTAITMLLFYATFWSLCVQVDVLPSKNQSLHIVNLLLLLWIQNMSHEYGFVTMEHKAMHTNLLLVKLVSALIIILFNSSTKLF